MLGETFKQNSEIPFKILGAKISAFFWNALID